MKKNLKDVTFLLLVRLDSIDRIENIMCVVDFINTNFDTNITVWECSYYNNGILKKLLSKNVVYKHIEDHDPILYRTMYLNLMLKEVTTDYVSVWDVDVITSKQQIIDSVSLLRNNEADFVYPYERFFLDTTFIVRKLYLKTKDFSVLQSHKALMNLPAPNPAGGAFFCDVRSYIKSGMENETFYGWGVEDFERKIRWERMGYRVKRISGEMYHLTHPRDINGYSNAETDTIRYREYNKSFRINNE